MTIPMNPGAMTAGELSVRARALGIRREEDLAAVLGVAVRTARHWLGGQRPIPAGVVDELAEVEVSLEREVETLLAGEAPLTLVTFATDYALWGLRPDLHPLGVRWWEMVLARVLARSPGARVVRLHDLDEVIAELGIDVE